ncbi:MAG: hypothetical protein WKG06_14880 [Segetibacter sp.]
MNAYFDAERTRRAHLANARFTKGRDEYLPIPKSQIDLSQNPISRTMGINKATDVKKHAQIASQIFQKSRV